MSIRDKLPVLEAILFAGGDPVDIDKICVSIESEKAEVLELLDMLSDKYRNEDSGIELLKLDFTISACRQEKICF